VEPAATPVILDEMVIPQIHEEEAAREEPPVLVDLPILATPPVVVESPVAANLPSTVRAYTTYEGASILFEKILVWCSGKTPSAIIKEIWGEKQLRVAIPRYKETQL